MIVNSVRVFMPGIPQGIPFERNGIMMVDGKQTTPPIICQSINQTYSGVAIDFSNGQRTVFTDMPMQFEYIGLAIRLLMLKDRISKKFEEIRLFFREDDDCD